MSPIETLGRILYGAGWISPLARDLAGSRSTVQSWLRSEKRMTRASLAKIERLAGRHARRADPQRRAQILAALAALRDTTAPTDGGRRPNLDPAQIEAARRLWTDPTLTAQTIAERVGLDRSRLYAIFGARITKT